MRIFSTNLSHFSQELLNKRKVELIQVSQFRDGEKRLSIPTDLSGARVCIVGDLSTESNFFSILLILNAFKYSGASEVHLIVPYLCYMRQDREFPGQPVSLEVVASCLNNSGLTSIHIFDIHSVHLPPLFNIPASYTSLIPYISKKLRLDDCILISPDKGAIDRVSEFNKVHNLPIVTFSKFREHGEISKSILDQCNVQLSGKKALIIDDILDSGGTLLKVCEELYKSGVSSVSIVIVHALFNGDSLDKFSELYKSGVLGKIYITNTVSKDYSGHPFVEVISISDYLFEVIKNIEC